MDKEELKNYFTEFIPYEGMCRFIGCTHTHEPDCKVKEALGQQQMFEELKDMGKQKYNERKVRD